MKPERSHLYSVRRVWPISPGERVVLPVIENLRAEDMPADSPHEVVALVAQPLMTQRLDIKVVHLKARVVNMIFGS